eukprot:SAG22_NODE_9801_length_569_cov_0.621277_1_plen_131_part_10
MDEFRSGYQSWRKGNASGAKGEVAHVAQLRPTAELQPRQVLELQPAIFGEDRGFSSAARRTAASTGVTAEAPGDKDLAKKTSTLRKRSPKQQQRSYEDSDLEALRLIVSDQQFHKPHETTPKYQIGYWYDR